MSGPIVPPLEVTEVDGSPSGRPITTIKVSNGDLTISGRTATIDTSGSTTTPATPADALQYNSDPAGTFTASSDLTYSDTPHAGTDTLISANGAYLGKLFVGQNGEGTGNQQIESSEDGGVIFISPRTTGEVYIQNDNAAGTLTDFDGRLSILHGSTSGNAATLRLRDLGLSNYAELYMGNNDLTIKVVDSAAANAGIDIKTDGTGVVSIKNDESNGDSELVVYADGSGTPIVKLENGSMAVQTICEANKKLTIEGGAGGDTFIFDVSSASGGITFPDATELVSAEGTAILATGVTDGYVLTADGAGASAWEEVSAGGGGFALPQGEFDATYKFHSLATLPPYGVNCGSTSARQDELPLNVRPRYFPFISPISVAPTSLVVDMAVAGSGTAVVGIYDARTADNYPGTLVATGEFDPSSTGTITITNTLSTALVAGALYYYAVRNDNNSGDLEGIEDDLLPSVFPGWRANITDENTGLSGNTITSGTALPATAAYGSGNPGDFARPFVWLVE